MLKYVEEKGVKRYCVEEEQTERLKAREKAKAVTSRANDRTELYEPLAGLELYGITYRAKRRERPTEEKLTKQSETRIDDREMAESTEFEEGIEMTQKGTQIVTREIERFAEMPEKSVQTSLEKFAKYKRGEKTLCTDAEIFHTVGVEGRLEKWNNKRKHRKKRCEI